MFSVGDTVLYQDAERVILEARSITRGGFDGDPKFYSREDCYMLLGSGELVAEDDLTYVHHFSTTPLVSTIIATRHPTDVVAVGEVKLECPVSDSHPNGFLVARIDTTNQAAMWNRCVDLLEHRVRVWCEVVNLPSGDSRRTTVNMRTIVKIEDLDVVQ